MISVFKSLRRFTTVDPKEQIIFSGYKWWNSDNALHPYTDVRIKFIKDHLGLEGAKPFTNVRVLDVGCGGGIVSERLGRLGATVLGVDPTPEAIEAANEHLPSYLREKVKYRNCEVSQVEGTFDLVVASEVIEHVSDPKEFLKQVSLRASPGGSVFLSTVNRTIESWLLAIIAAENIIGIVEPGTHSWDKFITPEELDQMCRDSNLDIKDTKGWFLDIMNFKALEVDNNRIGYMCHCIKDS